MTTSLSPTLAVTPTPATTLAAGVPCAARPGTSFRHLDGRCQCFFGGEAPQLAGSAYPRHRPDRRDRRGGTG
jgi:hypothetical protein